MSEVQKLELDAEAILKQIEDFFEHLLHHAPHADPVAVAAAKAAVTAAINPIPAAPVVVASGAPAVEPRIDLTESAS